MFRSAPVRKRLGDKVGAKRTEHYLRLASVWSTHSQRASSVEKIPWLCAEVLVELGADLTKKNYMGYTPFELAEQQSALRLCFVN